MKHFYKLMLLSLALLSTLRSSADVEIGNGNFLDQSLPIEPNYGYSYSQSIYLPYEIAASGTITGLKWYWAGNSGAPNSDSITIYLAHTSTNSFPTGSNWIPSNSLQQVFKGQVVFPSSPGWVTITFSTPFTYNGTSNLLVATEEDRPGYDGYLRFSNSSASSARSIYYYDDNTNPNPASPPSGQTSLYIPNITFVGITSSCAKPTNPIVSNITYNSCNIALTSTAANSIIEYGPAGFYLGTGTKSYVSGNSQNLTGLTPNTYYSYFIRAVCGVGDSSAWSGPYYFTTPCGPFPVPYFEGFETGYQSSNNIGGCLSQESITGSAKWQASGIYTTSYNRTPRTGNYCATLAYSNYDYLYIPIPLIKDSTYRFICFAKQNNTSLFDASISVDYGLSPTATDMTNSLVSATSLNTSYQLLTGTFTPDSTRTYYIGIKGYVSNLFNYLTLDDISIKLASTCDAPSSVTLAAPASYTTATVKWIAPPLGMPSGGYSWIVVPQGASPTATPLFSGTATADSISLTGLTANTNYSFYVKTNCSNNTSSWTTILNFTTPCNPFTVPYAESFETGYVDLTNIGGCLKQISISGSQSWQANSSTTTFNRTPRTGSFTATLQKSNSDYIFIPINLTGGTSYRFLCYAKQDTTLDGQITIAYGTSATQAGMTNTIVNSTNLNKSYKQIYGDFTPSTSGTYYIGILGSYMSPGPNYIILDDISVNNSPLCREPSAITKLSVTTTTAKLSWTAPSAGNTASGYDWVVVNSNGTIDSTPVVSGSVLNDTANITGLTPNTEYKFYVRSVCGTGSQSWWIGPFSFYSACNATQPIPYFEDFDSYASGLPNCWAQEDINNDNFTWAINNQSGCSGKSLRMPYNDNSLLDDWVFSPNFNMTGGTTYRLTFNYDNPSLTYQEDFELYVGAARTSTAALAGKLLFRERGFIDNNPCKKVTVEYTPTATGVYSFGWHCKAYAYEPSAFYIDNVKLDVAPSSTTTTVANNANNNLCTSYKMYGVVGNVWHYLLDNSGNTVLAVNPNGDTLGYINVQMKDKSGINTSNSINGSTTYTVMPRYYSITPKKQPTGNTNVRLYFLGSQLDSVNLANGGLGASNIGQSDVNIYKYTVTTPDCDYTNNTSSPTLVTHVSTAVGPTTGTRDFYTQFQVSSFSEFLGVTPFNFNSLALDISKFEGQIHDGKIELSWIVAHLTEQENVLVQKFVDQKWITIGTVTTTKEGQFNFIDENVNDVNVYRLAYSNKFTNSISIKSLGAETISIFPNPASGHVYVDITTIALSGYQAILYDMVGRKVMTQDLHPSSINKINVASLPTGNYMIKIVNNGSPVFTQKLLVN